MYTLIWTCTGIGIICFIYFCAKRKCFPSDDSGLKEPIDANVSNESITQAKPVDFGNHSISGDFRPNVSVSTKVEQNLNPTYNVGVYRDDKGRFRSIKDYYTTSTFV